MSFPKFFHPSFSVIPTPLSPTTPPRHLTFHHFRSWLQMGTQSFLFFFPFIGPPGDLTRSPLAFASPMKLWTFYPQSLSTPLLPPDLTPLIWGVTRFSLNGGSTPVKNQTYPPAPDAFLPPLDLTSLLNPLDCLPIHSDFLSPRL